MLAVKLAVRHLLQKYIVIYAVKKQQHKMKQERLEAISKTYIWMNWQENLVLGHKNDF